jgi:hypothetical protein
MEEQPTRASAATHEAVKANLRIISHLLWKLQDHSGNAQTTELLGDTQ